MRKYAPCPECGAAVPINNQQAADAIQRTGKRPKCAKCRAQQRAFDLGRQVERETGNYRELEY